MTISFVPMPDNSRSLVMAGEAQAGKHIPYGRMALGGQTKTLAANGNKLSAWRNVKT